MNFIAPHKFWLATLAFALMLMFFSAPALDFFHDKAAQHLSDVETARTKTGQTLKRLNDDIAMTQKLSGQIGADDVEKSLAYVDRLQAVDLLEKQASAARLDHFTYTLSPEQKIMINTPGVGAEELAISNITVKAEVPLDSDAYSFVERLHSLMPGRLKLQSITLERIGAEAAPPAANNLHMTANFEWLSNGAAKQVAERR